MTQYKMLGEFVCYCTKCKLELNHRIVLMDEDMPSRVLCLTCNSEHKYKKTPAKATKAKITKSATAAEKSKARQSLEEEKWRKKLETEDIAPTTYNINTAFHHEERLYHQKFGLGLVIGFDFPDKIHVFFDDGVKVLKGKKSEEQK